MSTPNLRVQLKLEVIEPRDVPAPLAFATPGGPIQVLEENGTTTQIANPFLEYAGPINIAVGDLIGVGNAPDGQADFVLAPGAGGGPRIVIVDGATRAMAMDFFAFDPSFRGGASVAVGDVIVNQIGTQPGSSGQGQVPVYDSKLELIVGAGPGGGPHVKVVDAASLGSSMAAPTARVEFMAFDVAFSGGVSVAGGLGAPTSSGNQDGLVIVGAGPGGGPNVRTFQIVNSFYNDLRAFRQQDFFAFDAGFRGGVSVAFAGLIQQLSTPDIENNSQHQCDIVVGAGPGGGPNIRIFAMSSRMIAYKRVTEYRYQSAEFMAYDTGYRGGVTVGFGALPGQSNKSILTSPSSNGGSHIRSFLPLAPGKLLPPTVTQQEGIIGSLYTRIEGVLEGATIAPGLNTFLQSASISSGATVSSSAP